MEPQGSAPRKLSNANEPVGEGKYRGALHDPRDAACGFEILDDFERFTQANDIYSRGRWDERVRSDKVFKWFRSMFMAGVNARARDGYTSKDFALKVGAWVGSNLTVERGIGKGRGDGYQDDIQVFIPPAEQKTAIESPERMAADMKRACKFYGADLVGITSTDLRWHYSHRYDAKRGVEKPNDIPDDLVNTIVIGTVMRHDIIKTYPSATASAAVGLGYSVDANILQSIATFIHAMGYRAVASMNDTAQRIPYAIQAGLGEYARSTLLISRDFGPRLRIGQIFTDMPLAHDSPIKFGVREFCQVCRRCAEACPPRAIPFGEPQTAPINASNFVGIRKWSVDAEKCFKFWTNQGTECGICIRVCPYNKDTSTWARRVYYRSWRRLAAGPLRKFALWLDIKLGFGKREEPVWWWRKRSED
ncbi:MAG: reductive dehalogenase [Alphaproteobacteria bacterium]